ncbi:MAG: hypothetical protein SV765_13535 [Pseudomonadota bacterium]|nr:hypothetical protein [Pseudomonadales bacterium]MDY6921222.1 hypothetical protein [Pseudomonadota bacterium]
MTTLDDTARLNIIRFGVMLAAREFSAAHGLLAPQLAEQVSAGDLEQAFDEMIVHFDTEDVAPVAEALQLVDEDAFGHWVYLPMEGDGELEAITLQVNPEGRILDIEWGKDWKSG